MTADLQADGTGMDANGFAEGREPQDEGNFADIGAQDVAGGDGEKAVMGRIRCAFIAGMIKMSLSKRPP